MKAGGAAPDVGDLPLAPGMRHIRAFEADGWTLARREGTVAILTKEGFAHPLPIPCERGTDVMRQLLRRIIEAAGLSIAEYLALFEAS